MKKLQVTNRLLSLLLAMSMVFSCVPVSAHAAEHHDGFTLYGGATRKIYVDTSRLSGELWSISFYTENGVEVDSTLQENCCEVQENAVSCSYQLSSDMSQWSERITIPKDKDTLILTTNEWYCGHRESDGQECNLCGVCMKTKGEHVYDENGICACGAGACKHENHTIEGCETCGDRSEAVHSYENGICACGAGTCKHENHTTDGVCNDCGSAAVHSYENGFCTCGLLEEPLFAMGNYLISNAGQLYWFAQQVNAGQTSISGQLTANIVVNETVLNADGTLNTDKSGTFRPWTPIGTTFSNAYRGTFNGAGHTISGLYFNDNNAYYVGLFGYLYVLGKAQDVGVVDSYFCGNQRIGGVVGTNQGFVTRCYNVGTVSGNSIVGGVVGGSSGGTVINCYYLDTCGAADTGNGDAKTAAQFASGEVTWLLNGQSSTGLFKQTLGTDAFPTFSGGTVYKNEYCDGTFVYSNVQDTSRKDHSYDGSGTCKNCGAVCDHTGNTNKDDNNCTTAFKCSVCKAVIVAATNHTGGEATCSSVAKCEVCGREYGSKDPDNHVYVNGFCACGLIEAAQLVEGYYQIGNAGQMFWFANHINTVDRTASAKLTADIDLGNREWTPIGVEGGNDAQSFRGTFDGNGKTIRGLYVDAQRNALGLFGEVRDGTVKDFTIYGEVKLIGKHDYVGGVIGSACGTSNNVGATISGITSYVNVTLGEGSHGSNRVAGLIGYVNHKTNVENCVWYGTLDLKEFRAQDGVGGLIGKANSNYRGTIRNCGAFGTIKTAYQSGSYTTFDTIYIGGILSNSLEGAQTQIENTIWAGAIVNETNLGKNAHISAFGTMNGFNSINNCYALNSAPYITTNGAHDSYITVVTDRQLRSGEIAYQLGAAWGQEIGTDGLPVLGGEKVYQVTICGDTGYSNTNATQPHVYNDNGFCTVSKFETHYEPANLVDGYYQIENAGNLFWLAQWVNGGNASTANAVLTCDIDLEEKSWTPIGSLINHYSGHFDGRGHTVSGLKIDGKFVNDVSNPEAENGLNAGLFGNIQSAGIRNLTVIGRNNAENSNTLPAYSCGAGLLVGHMTDSIVYNCYAAGEVVSTFPYVGGLVGTAQHSIIINCGSEADVSSESAFGAGGLVGYMTAGYDSALCLLNSWCTGDVVNTNTSSTPCTAGLVGYLEDDAVNNYYSGTVKGSKGEPIKDPYPYGSEQRVGQLFGDVHNEILVDPNTNEKATITPVIEKNYYLKSETDMKVAGTVVAGLDATNYGEACSDLSTLQKKMNGNLPRVKALIDEHREYLCTTQWAELVSLLNGEDVKAFHWWLGDNGLYLKDQHVYENGFCACGAKCEDHIPNADDGDCTTAITCSICGAVTTPAEDHTPEEDDGDCTTEVKCAVCGTVTTPAKANHTGGTATCDSPAKCDVCGMLYGETLEHVYENGFCTGAEGVTHYEPAEQEGGVYQIGNAGQLYWFAQQVNGGNKAINGKLTANIVVNADVLKTNGTLNTDKSGTFRPWTLIRTGYRGTFDGAHHTVSGLYFNVANTDYVGLFSYLAGGTVQNVGVVNSYFCGGDYVGGVVGENEKGTVANCYNTGAVTGSGDYVGGVVGRNWKGTVANCYNTNTGTVSGSSDVGGVVGYNKGEGGMVSECHNTGTVSGSSNYVGGVVGRNDGTVSNCYNTGAVTGSGESDYVGGVVGYNSYGTVTNCYNTGAVSGSGYYVGGVAGSNGGSISACHNSGAVTGSSDVGGVVGYHNGGEVTNCYNTNTGTVSGSGDYVGGVIGQIYSGTVTACHNSGVVSGSSKVGGVVGYNRGGEVANCYYLDSCGAEGEGTAKTEEAFRSGEVAWLLNGGLSTGVFKQTIGDDAFPTFEGDTVYQVTLCDGRTVYSNVNKSYDKHEFVGGKCENCGVDCEHPADKNVDDGDCTTAVKCSVCGTVTTAAKAHFDATEDGDHKCDNCNITNVTSHIGGEATCASQAVCTDCGQPYGELDPSKHDFNDNGFCTGAEGVTHYEPAELADDGYYQIGNAGQLYWFAQQVNGKKQTSINGKLTADIVVNEDVLAENGTLNGDGSNFRPWTPIGTRYNGYLGTFDGGKYTVSGLYFNDANTDYVGLFARVNGGTVRNVGIVNSYFCGGDSVGGVVGFVESAGSAISNCCNTGTVSGSGNYAGGVVAYNSGGMVSECHNTGAVRGGDFVGGVVGYNNGDVVGYNNGGTVANCYNTGTVSGSGDYVGGVVGNNFYGTVTNCYNTGAVTGGSSIVGGVVGNNHSGTVSGNYNTGVVSGSSKVGGVAGSNDGSISACHNRGTVSGSDFVGGVVGYHSGGEVANCYNTNTGTVRGNSYVGGVIGRLYSGTVTACHNSGAVTGSGNFVGGAVGWNNDNGTVTGCYNTGTVSGNSYVGGVAGENYGTLSSCYNTGTVSGSGDYVGGVVGWNSDTVFNCYNTGAVSGSGESDSVGGVVGCNSSGEVTSCYNSGAVTGSGNLVGGAVGFNGHKIFCCYYLKPCGAEGEGTAMTAAQFASGEVAWLLNGEKSDGVFKQTLGDDAVPTFEGDTVYQVTCGGEGTAYRNTNENYAAHKTENGVCTVCGTITCNHSENENKRDDCTKTVECSVCGTILPAGEHTGGEATCKEQAVCTECDQPYGEPDPSKHDFNDNGFCKADGTHYEPAELADDGYYQIGNAGQLYWFAAQVNGGNNSINGKLTANIEVNKNVLAADGDGSNFRPWTPISTGYGGTFDGGKYTVSGLYFNDANTNYVGLFGSVNGGTVKNVGVVNSYFCGGQHVGGVVGFVENAESAISNCYNTGTVNGSSSVGGVVGWNSGGTISNCHNTGTVSGSGESGSVGGVVGWNSDTVTNCYNTGAVSGSSIVGGVVGNNHSGTVSGNYNTGVVSGSSKVGGVAGSNGGSISACYNSGAVSGSDFVGGVVGYNSDGEVANCYNTNTGTVIGIGHSVGGVVGRIYSGTVTACHNSGAVSGSGDSVGGVVGWNNDNGTVTGCYNIGTVSGSGDYVGGVVGWNSDTVSNCYNTGTVSGEVSVGGVVGYNYQSSVSDCYNTGTVSGEASVGGVAGNNAIDSSVSNCYNTGAVSGSYSAGGAVGYNNGSVSNFYNTGAVSGSYYVGGVVGNNNTSSIVSTCYNIGAISGIQYFGGVVGTNISSTVSTCYYLDTCGASGEGTSKTAAQFASGEVAYLLNGDQRSIVFKQTLGDDAVPTFEGDTVYQVSCGGIGTIYRNSNENQAEHVPNEDDGDCTTELICSVCQMVIVKASEGHNMQLTEEKIESTCKKAGKEAVYTCANCEHTEGGEAIPAGHRYDNGICTFTEGETHYVSANLVDGYYEIGNAGQLYWFAQEFERGNTSIKGKLIADIVVNENVLKSDGTLNGDGSNFRSWTPIGGLVDYTGIFDGNGHTISGLYCNDIGISWIGLFGAVAGNCEIRNLGIVDSYFCGEGSDVGSVVGFNGDGTVSNCYNTGTVSGGSWFVGGVVGRNYGTVENCYNTGTVSGSSDFVGGVVGYDSSDTVENCYYLLGGTADKNATAMTAEQFASGEVAWLLNGGLSTGVFKQTLGDDAIPTFEGSIVYQVTCGGTGTIYRNTDENYENHTDAADGNHNCDVCGTENATDHTGGEATCKAPAVCGECGQSYGEKDFSNHTGETEWTQTADTHSKAYTCCGAVVAAAENHEWENNICKECGYGCTHSGGTATCVVKAVCEHCGQPYGEKNATNHTGVNHTENAKAPTCGADGYTGDTHCECGTKISGGTAIPATGDHFDGDDSNHDCDNCTATNVDDGHHGGEATCKAPAVCTECGQSYGEKNATNHTGVTHLENAKEATCGFAGYTGDTVCECGVKISGGEPIPATGEHVDGDDKNHDCDNCTATNVDDGHHGGEATCKAPAVCGECGQSYGEKNPSNHTGEAEWTQTADTHSKAYTCCGAVVVEAENHEWENNICKECGYGCTHSGGTATCVAKAVCEHCGQPYGEKNATNHTGVNHTENAKAPTCGADGYTGDTHCECGTKISGGTAIPATGEHVDGDDKNHDCDNCTATSVDGGHHGGEATCKAPAVCTECGQSYGEKNASNHTGEAEWTQTAEKHSKAYTCCGAVVVNETNHIWGEDKVCTECHYGCVHTYGTPVFAWQADCTSASVTLTCGNCKAEKTVACKLDCQWNAETDTLTFTAAAEEGAYTDTQTIKLTVSNGKLTIVNSAAQADQKVNMLLMVAGYNGGQMTGCQMVMDVTGVTEIDLAVSGTLKVFFLKPGTYAPLFLNAELQ